MLCGTASRTLRSKEIAQEKTHRVTQFHGRRSPERGIKDGTGAEIDRSRDKRTLDVTSRQMLHSATGRARLFAKQTATTSVCARAKPAGSLAARSSHYSVATRSLRCAHTESQKPGASWS